MDTENKNISENEDVLENKVDDTEDEIDYLLYNEKPLFEISARDNVFAVCAIIASVVTVALGVFGGFAMGYLFSVVLMNVLFITYLAKHGKKGVLSVLYGVLGMASGLVFIFTTNASVRFFWCSGRTFIVA